jgi:surface-anchored protein
MRITKIRPRAVLLMLLLTSPVAAVPVYHAGHADIGVDYLAGPPRFELKIRFDGNSLFEDGSTFSFQRVSPEAVAIRVPDPPIIRENYLGDPENSDDDYDNSGPEWNFLGVPIGEPVWFMPQTNDPAKPFFGFATDNLNIPQWSGPLSWSLEAILSAPAGGEVSLWQTGFFGDPNVKFASIDGINVNITPGSDVQTDDDFFQTIGGHDHYNWGFSKPGVYRVVLGATASRVGVGTIHGTGIFTFLVGDAAGETLPGDFDGDGDVDGRDFLLWQRGSSRTPLSSRDLADWQAHYGEQVDQIASSYAIPEPRSLHFVAAVIGIFWLPCRVGGTHAFPCLPFFLLHRRTDS